MKKKERKELKKSNNIKITFMKLRDIVNSIESLKNLTSLKLPVVTSYKLSLFLNKLQPELTTWDTKKNELIKEYGTPKLDKDGKETDQFEFKGNKLKEFNEKIEEIVEQDISLEVPEIKISDLGNIEIETNKLAPLCWLIKE